jgi:2-furoyl-CoA dehydrogenase FAD binding subunit
MKPAAFEYCRPDTLEEALAALAEFADDAAVMSGGLSLGALLNTRLVQPAAVIDINRITGLDRIEVTGSMLHTGPLVRQADALNSPLIGEALPLLATALPNVGHYQTRSRGTLAGSVAHADPSAEIPLCLAVLGGEVELASSRGRRRVGAGDFIQGALETGREGDEMLAGLLWPKSQSGDGVAFIEVSERHGDFAIAAAAAVARRDGDALRYTLGLGGIEDRARLTSGSAPAAASAFAELAEQAAGDLARQLDPMQDRRASAAYRRHLAGHLGAQALEQALVRAGMEGGT